MQRDGDVKSIRREDATDGCRGTVMVIDLLLNHCFNTSTDTAAAAAAAGGGMRLKEMRR